jgi:DNA-binding NtrC family response regulator
MKIETLDRAKATYSCGTGFSQTAAPARPRAILVADDDEGMRYFISTTLMSAGFRVNTVSDGQQAWEGLQHEHYDLLVTDNRMPRLAGIGLIQRMREVGMSLPVIMASGTFPAERVREVQQLRIAAVLTGRP